MEPSDEPLVRLELTARNYRLVGARKAMGYSQDNVRLLTGIPIKTISTYERLLTNPTPEDADSLASALDKSPNYLFPLILQDIVEEGLTQPRERYLTEGDIESHILSYAGAGALMQSSGEPYNQVEDRVTIQQAVQALPSRERRAIEEYFLRGGTLEQIGRDRGVTGARIGQITSHAKRLARGQLLRGQLRGSV